jgi:hypothetical protein
MMDYHSDELRTSLRVAIVLVAACLSAQSTIYKPVPPGKIIEQYLQMAAEGDLLTSKGWNRVNALFSTPNPEPKDNTVFVTTTHYSVTERWIKNNQAEVQDAWWDPVGSFDSTLRYTPAPNSQSEGNIGIYHLTLIARRPERRTDGVAHEATDAPQWRIEGPLTRRWTTVEAAIRYVSLMRDNSDDPLVKQNAEKTLEALRRHTDVKH